MIRCAVKVLEVDYLLMDSWFTCQKVLECALGLSVNVVGMMKTGKNLYEYNSVNYTAAELLNKLKKKSKNGKMLCSSYIEVPVKLKGNQITLFFGRFGKRGKWHVILCTDRKLDYRKMMELYQIRGVLRRSVARFFQRI